MPDTYTSAQKITTVAPGVIGSTRLLGNNNVSINFGVGIYEMPRTISTNYCITTGTGAFSAGPINIAAIVTVPDGSSWVIK
jgi:hypothetical protein